jgi:hypothetical protein
MRLKDEWTGWNWGDLDLRGDWPGALLVREGDPEVENCVLPIFGSAAAHEAALPERQRADFPGCGPLVIDEETVDWRTAGRRGEGETDLVIVQGPVAGEPDTLIVAAEGTVLLE